jgi:hypothetical protein
LRAFEKKVQRKIFGPMKEEVVEGWRRLHKKELHNLYDSSNNIRVIKSRRMRCWSVPYMGEMKNAY